MRFHLKHATSPSQLFYINFSPPFLAHDQEAVTEHNKIVEETQRNILTSIINQLEQQISALESNRNDLKAKNSIKIDLLNQIQEVEKSFNLKKDFDKADEKVRRIISIPYKVKSVRQLF